MTRLVVLGGGFAGMEAMRVLERRLGRVFPRDSAIMRRPSRCPICVPAVGEAGVDRAATEPHAA